MILVHLVSLAPSLLLLFFQLGAVVRRQVRQPGRRRLRLLLERVHHVAHLDLRFVPLVGKHLLQRRHELSRLHLLLILLQLGKLSVFGLDHSLKLLLALGILFLHLLDHGVDSGLLALFHLLDLLAHLVLDLRVEWLFYRFLDHGRHLSRILMRQAELIALELFGRAKD